LHRPRLSAITPILSAAGSHPDCRAILIKIVALYKSEVPFDYAVFTLPKGLCHVSKAGPEPHAATQSEDYLLAAWEATDADETRAFVVACSERATIGWARTTLPPYVN
jgi:hypothetical protein